MRIKGSLLILMTVCLGSALAMVEKELNGSAPGVVDAVTKDMRAHNDSGNVGQQASEIHFSLSSIKRAMPPNISGAGLFESKSWYAPPPMQAAPAPVYISSPQSMTPLLPFAFIGRMVDGNDVTLFLSKNEHQYTVKEKDVLDDTYRVDKISDSEAALTYLPTGAQQILLFNTAIASSLADTSQLQAGQRPIIPLQ